MGDNDQRLKVVPKQEDPFAQLGQIVFTMKLDIAGNAAIETKLDHATAIKILFARAIDMMVAMIPESRIVKP